MSLQELIWLVLCLGTACVDEAKEELGLPRRTGVIDPQMNSTSAAGGHSCSTKAVLRAGQGLFEEQWPAEPSRECLLVSLCR